MGEEKETALTLAGKVQTIRDLLNKSRDQIAQALPRHLNPDRLLRIAMTTIQRNPKLLECDPRTLVGSIMQCSQLGLEPDDILGYAYLVPFWNSRQNKRDVQIIVGYKGFIELAHRSGKIEDIYANIVYDKEEYKPRGGENSKTIHKPLPPAERGDKKIAVYAVAVFHSGRTTSEPMWADEVLKCKESSKTKDNKDSIWEQHEEEMWKKTAIRRLAKRLPLSPQFQKAAGLDELGEINKSQKEVFFGDEEIIEVQAEEASEKAQAKTEILKKKLDEQKAKAKEPRGLSVSIKCSRCPATITDHHELYEDEKGLPLCHECFGKEYEKQGKPQRKPGAEG